MSIDVGAFTNLRKASWHAVPCGTVRSDYGTKRHNELNGHCKLQRVSMANCAVSLVVCITTIDCVVRTPLIGAMAFLISRPS